MKVYVNRVPKSEPYGGGNQFLSSFVSYMKKRGHEVVYSLERDIDVLFVMDPRPSEPQHVSINEMLAYRATFPKSKIVHRVNECDSRKNTDFMDKILLETMKQSDVVVFISKWLQQQFVERDDGFKRESHVVYNGCDTDNFKPPLSKKSNARIKLVTHHWSDNWMKGFDIYTEIDKYLQMTDAFDFTYVGRYCKEYSPRKTKLVQPLCGIALGEELKKHDLYVTASRNEPCGMHHIEAAACGLPVLYHVDGGGINELAEKHGLQYVNFEDFLLKMNTLVENIENFRSRIDRGYLSIDRCCEEFANIIESV